MLQPEPNQTLYGRLRHHWQPALWGCGTTRSLSFHSKTSPTLRHAQVTHGVQEVTRRFRAAGSSAVPSSPVVWSLRWQRWFSEVWHTLRGIQKVVGCEMCSWEAQGVTGMTNRLQWLNTHHWLYHPPEQCSVTWPTNCTSQSFKQVHNP